MSINKNLKSYQELGRLKETFRKEAIEINGWSIATFYNKLSGSQPFRGQEEKALKQLFAKYYKQKIFNLQTQLRTMYSNPVLKSIKEKIV